MNHNDTVIDINAILDNSGPPFSAADCCIYKVPFVTRRVNEDAYTPKIISIGPFHHHHPRLQNMERHKLFYLKAFLQRTGSTLHTFVTYVESIIPVFNRSYSETLEFTNQQLVKLILMDSVFIIELFWRSYSGDWSQEDAFLLKPLLVSNIKLDLLLLENQLPFFILEKIFNISFTTSNSTHPSANTNIPSFLELTFDYFAYYNKSNLVSDNSDISIRHFTDLIRIFHLQHPLENRPPRNTGVVEHLPSVTELFEAGVRFKVNTNSNCLLDLRFSGGVLEIPELTVDGGTEILFRNMVALELCHYPDESYIADYVAVLDLFINTGRDVDILVQKRILVNWLGDSDSVANLVNSLWKNVTHSTFSSHLNDLCKELKGFCGDPLHKLKATLRRDYCSNPWKTAASIAGIFLLILTVLQSVCSVLQLVQQ